MDTPLDITQASGLAAPAPPARPSIYAPLFGEPPGEDGAGLFRGLDWDRLNVDVPYIIFMTGRCGSTWLTNLLRESNICGAPHEFFNETSIPSFNGPIKARSLADYAHGVVKRHSAGRRFGFEIDVWRFLHLLRYMDFEASFPAERSVFFWMTRDDIVSQAYSFATAKLRGQWHVFRDGRPGATPPEAAMPDDAAVWAEILRLVSREQRMEAFVAERGLRLHRLSYEQLVTDKHMVVMRIMDLLRCPLPAVHAYLRVMDDGTARLRYDGKVAWLGEFTSRYRPMIEQVLAERRTLDLGEFRAALKASAGIVA